MPTKQKWTVRDIDKLLNMSLAGVERREIALSLGRTGASINAKLNRLTALDEKLRKQLRTASSNRNTPWTKEDTSLLQKMVAANDGYPAIARALRRSQTEVAAQIYAIKISAG